jgi:hypothetical protein
MKRIMYVESKAQAASGRGRITWVELSKSCRVYRYDGRTLHKSYSGSYNCFDAGSGELFLVSDPKPNGRDKLHGGHVDIDEDVREEYWLQIRKQPESAHLSSFETTPRTGK